jgi:hypothetical protein
MSPRRNWDSPNPLSPASVPIPTLHWRKSLALCLLCVAGQGGQLGEPGLDVRTEPAEPGVREAGGQRQLHLHHRGRRDTRLHFILAQSTR